MPPRTKPIERQRFEPDGPFVPISPDHVKRFKRIATTFTRAINKLMEEIREYSPEANVYLENAGDLNLLYGPSHDDRGDTHQERVVCSVTGPRHTDTGAW